VNPSGIAFRKMAIALLFIALGATACLMPMQADSYWHLRAGEDIWRTGAVPLCDTYSYTAAGRPWPNHEWLWQAVTYALFSAGGQPLLVLASAAMAVGACAIIYRLMIGETTTRFVLMLLGTPLIAGVWAVRPQIATLLLLAALLWLLMRERYLWIPALFLLWANVHGAVALGGLVLATATVVAAFGVRRRFWTLLAVTAFSGLATVATPLGLRAWHLAGATLATARATGIMEWQPAYPTTIAEAGFGVLAVGFVVLVARRWRAIATCATCATCESCASWPDRVLLASSLVLLPLAIVAVRNIAPFVLVAMPASSRLLGEQFRWPANRQSADGRDHPRANLILVMIFALVAVAGVGVAWAKPHPRLGWNPIRPEAARAIAGCPGQVFNRYNEGGFLIWFVREKPVFVDSRYFPFPPEILALATGYDPDPRREPAAALFARHGIRCAALPPESQAAKHFAAAGWLREYGDDQWLLLTRP